MAFVYTWDGTFEALPPSTEDISLGAGRISDLKKALSERFKVSGSLAGDADDGKTIALQCLIQSSDPTVAATDAALYFKTRGGVEYPYWREQSSGAVREVVGLDTVQTLTNKTLTSPTINNPTIITPTIASFTNAGHDHSDAAGGGSLGANTVDSLQYVDNSIDTAHYAPASVDQDAIGAGAIGQGELKHQLQTSTGTNSGHFIITATGGLFTFKVFSATNALSSSQLHHVGDENEVGQSTSIAFFAADFTGFTSQNWFMQNRYIQGSPPYDLGNGEIPLFIFVVLDSNGDFMSIDIAPDPPWANNGPTNIRPTHIINGKKMCRQRVVPPKEDEQAFLEALQNPQYEICEITQELKQADMALVPHPFTKPKPENVVLLEPTGSICENLLELYENGEDVIQLLLKGYLQIENKALDINTPPGVTAIPLKWRNTG